MAYYLWNGRAFPFKAPIWSLFLRLLKAALRGDDSLKTSFLWNWREFPPVKPRIRLEPGLWAKVEASPAFLEARRQNSVSLFWDALIEYITDLYLDEDLEFGNENEMSDHERLVRLMAGETRFSRRILTKLMLQRVDIARENAISTLLPSCQSDVNYVLYIGKGDQGGNHEVYRAARMEELNRRCHTAKAVYPDRRWVVGMALDARGVKGSSEDFILMDTVDWTADQLKAANVLREQLDHFMPGKARESRVTEDEYPTKQA